MTESIACWVDGDRTDQVPAYDRGLAYGDGVFETMRVDGGRVRLLPRHLARLEAGRARLGFPSLPHAAIAQAIDEACRDTESGVLKLIVTRGDGARGYRPPHPAHPRWLLVKSALVPPPATLALCWCATPLGRNPALAGLKHLNRLEQVLARSEWTDDWDDGLMCDTAGQVVAATRANLFIVTDGVLRTPSLEQCGVAGIMRAMVGEAATALGIEYQVGVVTRDAVLSADEWLLTNAVHGVMPVARIGNRKRPAPGPVTARVAHWVLAHE